MLDGQLTQPLQRKIRFDADIATITTHARDSSRLVAVRTKVVDWLGFHAHILKQYLNKIK